jgi:hypothetical protein
MHTFITEYCKKIIQTYHVLYQLLKVAPFCLQTCLTLRKQLLRHFLKIIHGNWTNYVCYFILQSFGAARIILVSFLLYVSPKIKIANLWPGDLWGHSPLLIILTANTSCIVTMAALAVCAVALSCWKYPYCHSSAVSWLEKGFSMSLMYRSEFMVL